MSWKPLAEQESNNAAKSVNTMPILQKLFHLLRCGVTSVIVEEAKQVAVSIGIETEEMQDPTEFGSQLFDKLDEVLQQSQLSKELLGSIFEGTLQYRNVCLKCHRETRRDDKFMQLMIPIVKEGNKVTDIKFCLEKYLSSEEILEGENQCYCEGCNQKCDFRRDVYLHKLPPVLNIQLSRYCLDPKTFMCRKRTNKIALSQELILQKKRYLVCGVVSFMFIIRCCYMPYHYFTNWKTSYILCCTLHQLKHHGSTTDSGCHRSHGLDNGFVVFIR